MTYLRKRTSVVCKSKERFGAACALPPSVAHAPLCQQPTNIPIIKVKGKNVPLYLALQGYTSSKPNDFLPWARYVKVIWSLNVSNLFAMSMTLSSSKGILSCLDWTMAALIHELLGWVCREGVWKLRYNCVELVEQQLTKMTGDLRGAWEVSWRGSFAKREAVKRES